MRLLVSAFVAGLLFMLAGQGPGRAAVDATKAGARPAMELLVYEHPDCTYCQVFRARIAPRYAKSGHAAEAPLRFVDIAGAAPPGIVLRSPIAQVPTTVLVKDGREVDRIPGYWAPDNYFKMVDFLISRVE
jgi:thioredoxin-related protein